MSGPENGAGRDFPPLPVVRRRKLSAVTIKNSTLRVVSSLHSMLRERNTVLVERKRV